MQILALLEAVREQHNGIDWKDDPPILHYAWVEYIQFNLDKIRLSDPHEKKFIIERFTRIAALAILAVERCEQE